MDYALEKREQQSVSRKNETEPSQKKEDIQVVAFALEDEEFAVEINQVREVLKMSRITPLPQSLEFVRGVINLRGEVIPVVDLRKRLGLLEAEQNEQNRIIIVEIGDDEVGLIVDSANEVVRLPGDALQGATNSVAGVRADLIKAVGKIDDRLLILLNLEKLLTSEEQVSLQELTT